MMHAGQGSARKRKAAREAQAHARLATWVEDRIWEQEVRDADVPGWTRPAVIWGGLAVALLWAVAVAHGCT